MKERTKLILIILIFLLAYFLPKNSKPPVKPRSRPPQPANREIIEYFFISLNISIIIIYPKTKKIQ